MSWAVIKYFNYRKDTTQKTLSIHETEDNANKWAKHYCEEDCFDVSYSGEINACFHSTIYGKKDPWESWIFIVKPYTPPELRTDSPHSWDTSESDDGDDDDNDEGEEEEEDDDENGL